MWTNLKQAIDSVIRTNDNQEITGAILNNTLKTIVDTVGANATYAGIATSSTNPGTPDGPVFYFATEAGTYVNFGGATVTEGLTVLFWDGTSWSNESVFNKEAMREVYDISAANGNDTYTDLNDALTNGGVPSSLRRGGMSVKFILSSYNKYVQYRYTNTDAATNSKFVNLANWNEDNGEVWVDNPEWIRVVTDKDGNILAGIKGDGSIEWSVGVPMPVKEHVALLLEGKVDKEKGKSLIGSDIANGIGYAESPEWIKVEVDDEYNVLNGIYADGSHYAHNMHSETIDKNAEDIVTLNNKIEGMKAGNVKYDIIFASYDSSDYDKSIADYVCTETNAQEVIQNAIDDWYAHNEFNSGCFFFCAGTYIMTHFIEPDPNGDDRNGTPYCIVMPRGKVVNPTPNSKAHYITYCGFEGAYESQVTATIFKLSPDAYLLKSNGDIESLDDYTDDSSICMQETTISGVTYPARYLVDNKRYSLIRCVSDPTNPGHSMWCSYTMRIANMKFMVDGSAEDRRLTQYPIVMIDGLYASAIDLSTVMVSTATGIFDRNNDGAQHYNVGFTGIRCNQGQSRGTQQHMLNVGVSGFYHGIELGSEHWLIQDTVVLRCCMGFAFGCYHDTYGSGHANTFNTIALERNYYPMYFYYNEQFDNQNWVSFGNMVMNGLATEWVLYAYGQDEPETNGCHVEHYKEAPAGTIYCERPTNTQLFDVQSSRLLFNLQIICNNLTRCHLWSNIYGSPAEEHGIKSMVGEHGQIVFLTDKKCFVIWNNYNNNGPTNRGYWERLDGNAVEQN